MHPRTIFHGSLFVHWDPLNVKQSCPKVNLFGICEIARFPWEPITDSMMGGGVPTK